MIRHVSYGVLNPYFQLPLRHRSACPLARDDRNPPSCVLRQDMEILEVG